MKIIQCKKTARPPAPKRPIAQESKKESSNDEIAVVQESKKAKTAPTPAPAPKPKAAISSGQAWMEFIEALGRNRYKI